MGIGTGNYIEKIILFVLFIILACVNSLVAVLIIFIWFLGFLLNLNPSIDVEVKRKPPPQK